MEEPKEMVSVSCSSTALNYLEKCTEEFIRPGNFAELSLILILHINACFVFSFPGLYIP